MDEGRLTLTCYVWPDQRDRLAALRGAFEVATRVPVHVERAGAADWLVPELVQRAQGHATVVFHSIVWQYLTPQDQRRPREIINDAGDRALPDAPLASLRVEPSADRTHCDVL
jgi:hypothetical protein